MLEVGEQLKSFATSALSPGIYFAALRSGQSVVSTQFMVSH